MATITTRADLYDLANERVRVWKSITINNGDVLNTGLRNVWSVDISDASKWAAGGATIADATGPMGSGGAKVTFNLSAPFTGRLVIRGR